MNTLKRMRISTLGWGLVWTLLFLAALIVVFSLDTARNIAVVSQQLMIEQNVAGKKPEIVRDIRAAMGYGGVIQNVKDYVLRGTPEYRVSAHQFIGGAYFLLLDYEKYGTNEAEQVALADIKSVLDAYSDGLDLAGAMLVEGREAAEIDDAIRVNDSPALLGLDELDRLTAVTNADVNIVEARINLISRIRRAIGYGGAIHNFKNLVLRDDKVASQRVDEQIDTLEALLAEYRNLDYSALEFRGLELISETFRAYRGHLPDIERLRAEGASPPDIDLAVRVDDEVAIKGLALLHRELARHIAVQSRDAQASVQRIVVVAGNEARLVVGVTLLLVLFIAWIIRSRIVRPFAELSNSITKIAEGDLDVEIEQAENDSEIGVVATSLRVLRQRSAERLQVQLALTKSEALKTAVLRSVVDGIITIDDMGIVASINPAGERLFAYRADEVVGQNINMLMPEPYSSEHDGYLANYRRTGVAKIIGKLLELTARRKDGSVFSIELTISEATYGSERVFTGIVRDITQRKEVEERLKQSEQELREAYETVSRTVNDYLRTISEIATGDLTRRVKIGADDSSDLARFGGHLNTMTGNLAGIAKQISGVSEALVATLSEVTASVSQQVIGASEQALAVSETSSTLRQIEATTEQTLEKAQSLGESATRARKESELGLQAVAETIRGMESIRDRVAGIATTILTLSEQSQQIGSITRSVTKLAQQSKLVSLNASIEAAKAGDAGKGFAVVATEVKDLAEQSEQSIDQIQRILEDIRHATDRAVMATEEGSKGVDAGVALVMRTGEIMHQLSEVVRETTLSSQQIVAAVRQEASGINQVGDSMREVDAALAQNVASNRQLEAAFASMLQMAGKLKESIQTYRFEK